MGLKHGLPEGCKHSVLLDFGSFVGTTNHEYKKLLGPFG